MKFLCLECDQVMSFAERQLPGDGTLAAVFECGSCGREMAMLTNPMETQLVSGMGVRIGGRTVPEQPMEITRTTLEDARQDALAPVDAPETGRSGDADAAEPPGGPKRPAEVDLEVEGPEAVEDPDAPGSAAPEVGERGGGPGVHWTPEAVERLQRVPRFVRGMVKRIYTDYAKERGIDRMTPDTMDRARTDLGLEGM